MKKELKTKFELKLAPEFKSEFLSGNVGPENWLGNVENMSKEKLEFSDMVAWYIDHKPIIRATELDKMESIHYWQWVRNFVHEF